MRVPGVCGEGHELRLARLQAERGQFFTRPARDDPWDRWWLWKSLSTMARDAMERARHLPLPAHYGTIRGAGAHPATCSPGSLKNFLDRRFRKIAKKTVV